MKIKTNKNIKKHITHNTTKGSIPSNIHTEPKTTEWGLPNAAFPFGSWCPNTKFNDLNIIINTALCGDWAGNTFTADGCGANCVDFVKNNATAFVNAYWDINFIKIFHWDTVDITTTTTTSAATTITTDTASRSTSSNSTETTRADNANVLFVKPIFWIVFFNLILLPLN